VHGILFNAVVYFPWAKCQFFILQILLRDELHARYTKLKRYERRTKREATIRCSLPRELAKGPSKLCVREVAQSIWRNGSRIKIPPAATLLAIQMIYEYLQSGQPWEQKIDHIIPRDPSIYAASDASKQGIGLLVPMAKVYCLVPVNPDLADRFNLPQGHSSDLLHINTLEFIGVFLAYVVITILATDRPATYPPATIMHINCDNTSAIAWCSKMGTAFKYGQALLRVYAEIHLISPVATATHFLAGRLNVAPTRPCLSSL
jgi:hypothetical protein